MIRIPRRGELDKKAKILKTKQTEKKPFVIKKESKCTEENIFDSGNTGNTKCECTEKSGLIMTLLGVPEKGERLKYIEMDDLHRKDPGGEEFSEANASCSVDDMISQPSRGSDMGTERSEGRWSPNGSFTCSVNSEKMYMEKYKEATDRLTEPTKMDESMKSAAEGHHRTCRCGPECCAVKGNRSGDHCCMCNMDQSPGIIGNQGVCCAITEKRRRARIITPYDKIDPKESGTLRPREREGKIPVQPRTYKKLKRDHQEFLKTLPPVDLDKMNFYSENQKLRTKLRILLEQHRKVFARNKFETGTYVHPVKIAWHRHVPQVVGTARSIPLNRRKAAMQLLSDLTRSGVIRSTLTNWSSGTVFARKAAELADGGGGQKDTKDTEVRVRLCTDLRQINKYVRSCTSYITSSAEVSKFLSDKKVASCLDISQAFFSIRIDGLSANICAIVANNSVYAMDRLPMGLKGSSHIFASQMQHVTRHHAEYCMSVADNLLIASEDEEQHLQHISKVLTSVESHGFRIKVNSCHWAITERLTFLGVTYNLKNKSLTVDTSSALTIMNLKRPTKVKELKKAIGSIMWCARGYKNLQEVMYPLNKLLRNKTSSQDKLEWTKEAIVSWETMKVILTSSNCIHLPDKKLEKHIWVDASPSTIGMSLGQFKDGELQYIGHHSKTLTPSQQAWPQCEREFYGLLEGLKFAQDLLGDEKIICHTDCKSLSYLISGKNLSKKFCHWYLRVCEFNMDIIFDYARTKPSRIVDYLSRNIEPDRESGIPVKRLRAKEMKDLDNVIKDQERMTFKELEERLKPITKKIQEEIKQEIQDEERRKKENKKTTFTPKKEEQMIEELKTEDQYKQKDEGNKEENPKKKKGRKKKRNAEESEEPKDRERTQKIYAMLEEARNIEKLPAITQLRMAEMKNDDATEGTILFFEETRDDFKDNIFDAQMRDHILCALREKVRRQRERGKQERHIFQRHGILCQKSDIDGQTFLRILLPPWRALDICQQIHRMSLITGHMNRRKLLRAMQRRFSCDNMRRLVDRTISDCSVCTRHLPDTSNKNKMKIKRLKDVEVGDLWAIDKLTISKKQSEMRRLEGFFIATDIKSKFTVTWPVEEHYDSEKLTYDLISNIVATFGVPKLGFLTDSEWYTHNVRSMTSALGTSLWKSPSNAPWCNASERFNRYLLQIARISREYHNIRPSEWYSLISFATAALNHCERGTEEGSPASKMFNRRITPPWCSRLTIPLAKKYYSPRIIKLLESHEIVTAGIAQLKKYEQMIKDKRAGLRSPGTRSFPPGTLVMKKIFPVNPSFKKLRPKFNGPWRVVEEMESSVLLVPASVKKLEESMGEVIFGGGPRIPEPKPFRVSGYTEMHTVRGN